MTTFEVSHDKLLPNLNSLFSLVVARAPHLTTLGIQVINPNGATPEVFSPSRNLCAALAPLFPLVQLRALRFELCHSALACSSADVRAALDAWPALEDFSVRFRAAPRARVALDVLAHVARACPRLRVMHLPWTALVAGSLDAARVGHAPHLAMRTLGLGEVEVVGASREEAEAEIVGFVEAVFPMTSLDFRTA
ncbi:uncharacterized protein BXZ73DRAFT_81736 [Epithele typhae]|uniref:uncharacterized protein n=1 Tax=Epithele typhae TaxID=378194 RepID=UPI002008C4C9|nr:uncharacterized protein BXZ73DRAFT_81736 [Epithele typhae]KAH9914058.1 hypothetical protein BXZ73DRAFT_81736 [Epithele typhae]